MKLANEQPMFIYTKKSHATKVDYSTLDLSKNITRKSTVVANALVLLWLNEKSISEVKMQDVKSVAHLILGYSIQFYNNL